jgi:DHA2 family multidrug resistance protein
MFLSPQLPFGLSGLNGLIGYRAAVEAYANDFLFMFYISLPVFVVIWMMKRPNLSGAPPPVEAMD